MYGKMLFQRTIYPTVGSSDYVVYTLIRFADDPRTFYITSQYKFDAKGGDCVMVRGTLNYDANGVPFMNTDSLSKCNLQ